MHPDTTRPRRRVCLTLVVSSAEGCRPPRFHHKFQAGQPATGGRRDKHEQPVRDESKQDDGGRDGLSSHCMGMHMYPGLGEEKEKTANTACRTFVRDERRKHKHVVARGLWSGVWARLSQQHSLCRCGQPERGIEKRAPGAQYQVVGCLPAPFYLALLDVVPVTVQARVERLKKPQQRLGVVGHQPYQPAHAYSTAFTTPRGRSQNRCMGVEQGVRAPVGSERLGGSQKLQ